MVRRAPQTHRSLKPTQTTSGQCSVADGAIVEKMRPGRHLCDCQARRHELIRNCLGCGKVVCAQEGSGPCLSCGMLVCTREEREVLERGSRKSAELYKKLTGEDFPTGTGSFSLTAIGRDIENAVQFRDRLLVADADKERRTRVNDLESDYSNIDRNPFLTKEEREAIRKRREELHRIREERRRAVVVSIDLENRCAQAVNDSRSTDPAYDPIICEILDRSNMRRGTSESVFNGAIDAHWIPKGFVPKYACDPVSLHTATAMPSDANELCVVNEEANAYEIHQKGYALGISQPAAALLANGRVKAIRWHEDLHLKGPIFICATTDAVNSSEVESFNNKYVHGEFSSPVDFTPGTLQGRAYLNDILTIEEFEAEKGSLPVCGSGPFVLLFSSFEPLPIPVPYIPPSDFFQLDKSLREAMSHVFAS